MKLSKIHGKIKVNREVKKMKKNNKLVTAILSLVLGAGIFFIIDWIFYMNFITGNSKTVTFLLGIVLFIISSLYLLMNETDKKTIQSIDYKNNFFGKMQKGLSKILKATSKYMVLASVVIIVLSRFI